MAYKNIKTLERIAPHLEKVVSNDDKTYIYMFSINYKGTRINRCNLNEYFPREVKNDNTAKLKVIELKTLLKNGINLCKKQELGKSDITKKKKIVTISELIEEELLSRVARGRASSTHVYNINSTYMKHMDKKIGKIKISDITLDDLKEILKKSFLEVINDCKKQKIRKQDVLRKIKKVLRPTFEDAIERGYIDVNPLDIKSVKDLIATTDVSDKSSIDIRVKAIGMEALVKYAHLMYKSCLSYSRQTNKTRAPNEDFRLAFIFTLMTARRTEEVLKLRYKDLTGHGTIVSPKTITKSEVEEEYPLPHEVLDKLNPEGEGLIFPRIKTGAYHRNMRKLLDKIEIETHDDHKLYGHDKRNLFTTIMAEATDRDDIADTLLSHKNGVKGIYQVIPIDTKIPFFNKYWEIMRTGKLTKRKERSF